MDHIWNRVRAEAMRAQGLLADTRMGIVTGYDPTTYSAKVNIMPDAGDPDQTAGTAETGWLPISTSWSGQGWGLFCPPTIGDQVQVEHVEGDVGSGIIVNRVFDAGHLPVSGVPSGQWYLVDSSGASIRLMNTGEINISGQVNVMGNLTASENLAAGNGASGSFVSQDGLTVTVQDGIITNIY